jgi:uncharacterized cupin superfamily protein
MTIIRDGKVLDPSLYTWNENTKTFSTKEEGLVLDFTGVYRVTFNTGHSCTFLTGIACTFNTGSACTFKTDSYCTFNTGSDCTFRTGYNCTFNTGSSCTFKTGHSCTFNTGSSCSFKTGPSCTFEVGENCFVRRSDVKGVTEIPTNKKIKLNGSRISGYTVIEEKIEVPTCNGEVIEIGGKKYKLVEGKE